MNERTNGMEWTEIGIAWLLCAALHTFESLHFFLSTYCVCASRFVIIIVVITRFEWYAYCALIYMWFRFIYTIWPVLLLFERNVQLYTMHILLTLYAHSDVVYWNRWNRCNDNEGNGVNGEKIMLGHFCTTIKSTK